MIDFTNLSLKGLAIHFVGSKTEEEGLRISPELTRLDKENVLGQLLDTWIKPLPKEDFYRFTHATDLKMNEVYGYCGDVFEDPGQLLTASVKMVKHLYEQSHHPRIMAGEVCVALFDEIQVEDEVVEAIGIFKSENKDTFLKFDKDQDVLNIHAEQGIKPGHLDKGVLILNTEGEDGYRLLIVDRTSLDAQYWREYFLNVAELKNDNFYTQNYLTLVKDFVKEVVSGKEDRKEQVEILNKSLNYFNQNESFDLEEFTDEVMEKPELKMEFQQYQKHFESTKTRPGEEEGTPLQTGFKISAPAVKKMQRSFRNLIKLDTNIEIRLNGDENVDGKNRFVERGFDEEKGMFYYKVFFRKES